MKMLICVALLAVIHSSQACMPQSTSNTYFPTSRAQALAVITGKNADNTSISGTVTFSQATINDPVIITVNITGLQKAATNTKRGLHVHQNGITVISTDISAGKLAFLSWAIF
jgi:Cu/Zn superoxide dismutase